MAIPNFDNGARDLATVSDVANSASPTTVTRMGDTIPTLRGVLADISAATGLAYTSKAAMDAVPGTKAGQVARVTEGADAGFYLWSGTAWVKTNDPMSNYDALSLNVGKDYPMMAVNRGGTAPLSVHPAWKSGLVAIRLEGAQEGLAYRLAVYSNGASGRNGVTVFSMPMSDLTAQTEISNELTSPSFVFDRVAGGIQLRSAIISEGLRLTIMVDVNKLPAYGALITSAPPNTNGYNSIISPDCYFIERQIKENSLTINSGKDYPCEYIERNPTSPTAINPFLKSCLQDAEVFNARPGYSYRVSMIQNGGTISGTTANYGVTLSRVPNSRIAEGYEQNILAVSDTTVQLVPDRIKGGVQVFDLRCSLDPQTTVRLVIDVNKMPPDGTILYMNTPSSLGYNARISPNKYRYADPFDWKDGEGLFEYDATASKKLKYSYKSKTKWYRVQLAPRSINQTFSIVGFSYAPAYTLWGDVIPVEFAQWTTRADDQQNDYLAPVVIEALTGPDPGLTEAIYTSGSHSTDGEDSSSGQSTAETILLNIYADGAFLDLTKSFSYKARDVKILTANKVLGWNTINSRRFIAEEYFAIQLSVNGIFVHKTMKALEPMKVTADNGCQMYFAGFTPLTSTSYLMFGSSQNSRKNFDGVTIFNSGPKSAYPKVYGASWRHAVSGEMTAWIDPNYGVGTRDYLAPTDTLLDFPRANGKMYFRLFTGNAPLTMAAGDTYKWRGGYYWGMPTSVPNFDTVLQVQEGVLAVKPNGTYAVS